MSTQPTNAFETEFTARRLDTLAENLEYRDWTFTLLQQRIAELDVKLAAGDMPILERVDDAATVSADLLPPTATAATDAPEEDDFAAFMES